MDGIKLTPTQQRMIDVLGDGKLHTRQELHTCLCDRLGSLNNIREHLNLLRKKLQPAGMEVKRCLLHKYRLTSTEN
jgi:hypothetical protein